MQILPKPPNAFRILHTADWHIGKQLAGEHRYAEFGEFLDWLVNCIIDNEVDALIIAGDVFDTMTPSHTAQELYFDFLGKLKNTHCQNVVIIAGNHDSPSLLDAPKTLFRHFNIHVIGTMTDNIEDEVITLNDKSGKNVAIIAGVPYLRERDVRTEHFGSTQARESSMLHGIYEHYQTLAKLCKHDTLPVIATGHLFTQGATPSADDDGMRKLYAGETKVGTLGLVGLEVFEGFDYVALGHIHREQAVGGKPHIRYSGSPMAFCFDEVNQDKKVLVVDFEGKIPTVSPITVPTFRTLVHLKGDWEDIKSKLITLAQTSQNHTGGDIWLAVECQKNAPADLKNAILGLIENHPIQLLIYKKYDYHQANKNSFNAQSLSELTPHDVFCALLNTSITKQQKKSLILDENDKQALTQLYQEMVFDVENHDSMAI